MRIAAIDGKPAPVKRTIRHYIRGEWFVEWTGPVERRDPATYQRRSEIQTWLCYACRTWTMHGAYKVGRCNWCHEPRA